MKKSDELLKQIQDKTEACKNAHGEEKANLFEEIKALKKDREIELELEAQELQEEPKIENKIVENIKEDVKMENKVSLIHAMVKEAQRKTLTGEEAQAIQNAVTGEENVLVKEFSFKVRELLRKEDSLRELINVKEVKGISGQFPIVKANNGELVPVVDGVDMTADTDMTFEAIKFELEKLGALGLLNDTLLAFSQDDLLNYLAKELVKRYVKTVNKKVIEIADAMSDANAVVLNDAKALVKHMRTKIDRALQPNAVLLMNQSAFEGIASSGNQSNFTYVQPDITKQAIPYINGNPVVVVSDDLIPNDTTGVVQGVAYYGNFKEAMTLFESGKYEVSMFHDFLKNVTFAKLITYMDIEAVDNEAIAKFKINL